MDPSYYAQAGPSNLAYQPSYHTHAASNHQFHPANPFPTLDSEELQYPLESIPSTSSSTGTPHQTAQYTNEDNSTATSVNEHLPRHSGPLVEPHQDLNEFLESFWGRQMDVVESENPDFKTYPLPLARIKKVMKSDEEVKMISAEAPIMFSKACEVFISELTCRAWLIAESHKRRTLQKSDVAAAIAFSDMFDFLIDVVPREEGEAEDTAEAEAEGEGEGGDEDDGEESDEENGGERKRKAGFDDEGDRKVRTGQDDRPSKAEGEEEGEALYTEFVDGGDDGS